MAIVSSIDLINPQKYKFFGKYPRYVIPEHALYILSNSKDFRVFATECRIPNGGKALTRKLEEFIKIQEYVYKEEERIFTPAFTQLFEEAQELAESYNSQIFHPGFIILPFFKMEDSYGAYFLNEIGFTEEKVLATMANFFQEVEENTIVDEFPEDVISESQFLSSLFEALTNGEEPSFEKTNNSKRRKSKSNPNDEVIEDDVDEDFEIPFAVNMTKLAQKNLLGPVIGRTQELNRLIQILHKKRAANAVIVGHPGVGKTALVEALAIALAQNKVPPSIKDATLWALDLPAMIAGSQYRGELEQRLKEVLDLIQENSNVIIFIDEVHIISGSHNNDRTGVDIASILKPYLSGSNLRCIGATTYDDYRNSFSKDAALSRRFKKIDLLEVSSSETLTILKGIRKSYEKFHNVKFSDKILQEIIDLSSQYISNLYFPDKAIEIMDELGSMYKSQLKQGNEVTSNDVEELISKMANISSIKAKEDDKVILKQLKENITSNLYGQDQIVDKVVNHIKLARAGLTAKNRPLGVFGFLGKSGTGKTELAKQLAKALGISFIRLDMSEYSEEISISKLLGGAPGYVGFDQPGALTEPVLQNPHCVLLLDEIEKAHRKVYEVLLPIMDEGQISDNKNRLVSFKNTIIILTGNVGSARAEVAGEYIGFSSSAKESDVLSEELKRAFAPEFRNRFTEIFQFNNLGKEQLAQIVDKEIRHQNSNLKEKKITLTISTNAINFIVDEAFKENMGGRPIERIVNKIIASQLVDMILFDNLSNCNVLLDLVDNQVKVVKKAPAPNKNKRVKKLTCNKNDKLIQDKSNKQSPIESSIDHNETCQEEKTSPIPKVKKARTKRKPVKKIIEQENNSNI